MEENTPHKKVVIATHNGNFHADDIFAVATVFLVLEREGITGDAIEIVRTRDIERIAAAEYVVDVGGEYDPAKKRFDHHQKGGAGLRENKIPYASFGLVWKEYGEGICGSREVMEKMEWKLVMSIDAPDNSLPISTSLYEGVEPYTIYDFFKTYRLQWGEQDNEKLDRNFLTTVMLAKHVLAFEIEKAKNRQATDKIVEEIYQTSERKNLIIFETAYPWERILQSHPDTRLVVYPRPAGDGWNTQVISKEEYGTSRIYFPESWAGLRNEQLEKVTGVTGAIFCLNTRWLCGGKTKEGAIALAELALKEAENRVE